MNAFALSLELERQRSRTRKTTGVSLLLHALLFLLVFIHRTITPDAVALTEIGWIEPEPVVTAPSAPAAKRNRSVPEEVMHPRQKAEHFVRKTEKSDFAPRPQEDNAVKDRLNRKLASLEQNTGNDRPEIASLAASKLSRNTTLAAVPDRVENSTAPAGLNRADKPSASPVRLSRSDKPPAPSRVRLGTIPEETVKPATVAKADSTAHRIVDGMSLAGPVADRAIVKYGKPGYPDWAKREGIEGSVELYFIVLPNGEVKENVLVQKTSGFEDFDKRAIRALLAWRFEPLKDGRTGEQWGAITFDYELSD